METHTKTRTINTQERETRNTKETIIITNIKKTKENTHTKEKHKTEQTHRTQTKPKTRNTKQKN